MKLIDNGRFWGWDEKSKEKDLAIMALQRGYKQKGLSIWGTTGCERCGACCYKFRIPTFNKPQYETCSHLTVSDSCASCDLHKAKKPRGCKVYGCWEKKFPMGTDAERLQLIRMAIDILKTKPESKLQELIESSK